MVVIEANALITIVVAVMSIVISSFVTWFFSRRRYSRIAEQITEQSLEMQELKNDFWTEVLRLAVVLVGILGFLGFFVLLVILAR